MNLQVIVLKCFYEILENNLFSYQQLDDDDDEEEEEFRRSSFPAPMPWPPAIVSQQVS